MKTTVSVLLYRTQQKEIELAAKAAALKQKSKVEEQKRKLKLRELMLLAELEEEMVRIETEQQEIDLHAGMQANKAVSKLLQHHEERSGASVDMSSRIAEVR